MIDGTHVLKFAPMVNNCAVCGYTESRIIKGMCVSHYQKQLYKDNRDVMLANVNNRRANDPEHAKAIDKKRYYKNREERLARARGWAKKNPEKRRAICLKWSRANPEKVAANGKLWRAANPDKVKEKELRWCKANPEKLRAKNARWRKNNPEKIRAIWSNKQARRRAAEGKHTAAEIKDLMIKQRGSCAVCKTKLDKNYHKDHIVPLISHGTNDIGNIQLLCPFCNQSKHSKDPIEFMQSRGFLL